jgi:hypothetical protein
VEVEGPFVTSEDRLKDQNAGPDGGSFIIFPLSWRYGEELAGHLYVQGAGLSEGGRAGIGRTDLLDKQGAPEPSSSRKPSRSISHCRQDSHQ